MFQLLCFELGCIMYAKYWKLSFTLYENFKNISVLFLKKGTNYSKYFKLITILVLYHFLLSFSFHFQLFGGDQFDLKPYKYILKLKNASQFCRLRLLYCCFLIFIKNDSITI